MQKSGQVRTLQDSSKPRQLFRSIYVEEYTGIMRIEAYKFAGMTHEQFPRALVSVQLKQIIKVLFAEGHGVSTPACEIRRSK